MEQEPEVLRSGGWTPVLSEYTVSPEVCSRLYGKCQDLLATQSSSQGGGVVEGGRGGKGCYRGTVSDWPSSFLRTEVHQGTFRARTAGSGNGENGLRASPDLTLDGREMLIPLPAPHLLTKRHYLQSSSEGAPSVFVCSDWRVISEHKRENLCTSHYKIDFPSPFHSDNQMKNTLGSDLAPRAS